SLRRRRTGPGQVGDRGGVLSRIAPGRECVRPAAAHAVLRRQFLRREQPRAVSRTLVLELNERAYVTVHHFEDTAHSGLGRECVERTDLERVFVADVGIESGELYGVGERAERAPGGR